MFTQLAIIGTTASGKSNLAIDIALQFKGVILSLDSLALYKQIDIASAKPTKQELEKVLHFGIDLIYPNENFSVGEFISEYKKAKKFARQNSCPLIITGGSGFYLKAMLSGLAPKINDVKTSLLNSEIYELICKIDPNFAVKFSRNDTFRLQKWYSIYKSTGEIPSRFLQNNTSKPVISDIPIFEIIWDKEILRKRIYKRTHKMLQDGLIKEAKYLFSKYDKNEKALKSIGLKECLEYIESNISIEELENLISIHTVQLAKRQRTFNRSQFTKNKFSQDIKTTKILIKDFLSKIR